MTVRLTTTRNHLRPQSFDRSFDQLVASFFEPRRSAAPVFDAAWVDDEYQLTVDLPGVPAAAVNVEVSGATLTVAVDTPSLQWTRSLQIGGRLDPESVSAHHVDGRLTIRISQVAAPAPRRIELSTVAPAPASTPALVQSGDSQSSADSDAQSSTDQSAG